MKYEKIDLTLENPLSFWGNFADSQERFFWYNRQQDICVVGAERLSALTADSFADYPFLFHTQTFFDDVRGDLWQDFGGETLAFKHYYVKTADASYYLTCETPRQIEEMDFPTVQHEVVEKAPDYAQWTQLFDQIQENFAAGKTQKIVASRELEFTADRPFNIESILQNLIQNNPNCFIFAYQKSGKTFLGATPEILVQKKNDQILSYALAGTMPRTLENAGEFLLHDQKNLQEHAIVVNKIKQNLLEKTDQVTVGETELMTLKNMYHLRTILTAVSASSPEHGKAVRTDRTLTEWASQLHPTPALGGEPRQAALDFLQANEPHERGLYAAPIGLFDNHGNGTIAVGIRSALIENNHLHAYAGCGIIPSSDCQTEFNETKTKLKTILEAL